MSTIPSKYFSEANQEIFATLSVTGRYKIIGSASLQGIYFKNDFDLAEHADFKNLKSAPKLILKIFREKFKTIHDHPDWWITDFKCGEIEGEPLRWDKKDIARGYKLVKGNKMYFVDYILQKSTMKLDMVVLMNGLFTEYTENYLITIGGESNFTKESQTPNAVVNDILKSGQQLWDEGNYFKALKREYSYFKAKDTQYALQDKLVTIFNSVLGLTYKCKSDLATITLVLLQKCKPVHLEDIKMALQNIKQSLANSPIINPSIVDIIDKICRMSNKSKIAIEAEHLAEAVLKVVNKETEKMLKSNKPLSKIFSRK